MYTHTHTRDARVVDPGGPTLLDQSGINIYPASASKRRKRRQLGGKIRNIFLWEKTEEFRLEHSPSVAGELK